MRIPRAPHTWTLSPKRAIAVQRKLADRVRFEAPEHEVRRIAGVDCAFPGDEVVAAAVLYDIEADTVVEQHVVRQPVRFPYVPGLLSFREVPPILAALRRLHGTPDAVMCDGHGFAHPRRFGLACHVGVLCDLPSIGVAKTRLVGTHREPGIRRGARTALVAAGERIGTVLRTRDGVRPIYVSVGHRIDLETAVALALRCSRGYRQPEPTRLADRTVTAARRP